MIGVLGPMEWLTHLSTSSPVAHAVLMLAAIAVVGLGLAAIRVRGIGLGIAGVLFAGIVFGHFRWTIDPQVLSFVREFGLILFVFTIGLQLGPSFFASLHRQGLRLNLMAASVVLLGMAVTALGGWLLGIDWDSATGLFTGATTNTPALAAAQETLRTMSEGRPGRATHLALAYAVGYPIGILGIILTLILLRAMFKIDPGREAKLFLAEQRAGGEPLERMTLIVENPNLERMTIGQVPGRRETGVVISRIQRGGESEVSTATEETPLHMGDVVVAVGTRRGLEQFRVVVGRRSDVDLLTRPSRVMHRRIVVTRTEALGKTVRQLGLDHFFGVTVTRVTRADMEMTAVPDLGLQFGDMLVVVGDEAGLENAARTLGNSLEALNATNFIPIFIGIGLGVLAGALPIRFPGMPAPIRLGMAGGPLVLALLLGRLGRLGPLVWYMPGSANVAIRELGIILFLACVGLKAGERFFETVLSDEGLKWALLAIPIAMLPILVIGVVSRAVFKLNLVTISGLISGSLTDPPGLAFASTLCGSDGPYLAYATVYPLTMVLRIVAAQVMALVFCG